MIASHRRVAAGPLDHNFQPTEASCNVSIKAMPNQHLTPKGHSIDTQVRYEGGLIRKTGNLM